MKKNPGIALKIYNVSRKLFLKKYYRLSKVFYFINYIFFGCVIPPSTEIEDGCVIAHSTGIVIHQWSKIGSGTTIYQNVTIGNAGGPKIGRNCVIGAGACVLGDIVIGDNVRIGANAVVLKDLPSNCTAVGVPARIVKRKFSERE